MVSSSAWAQNLQPASYNAVQFHVDVNTRGSGRRNAIHEFPKRDLPYAEDMGRRARKFTVNAYIIGPNYVPQRDALIAQLELESPGSLILPTGLQQTQGQVNCDTYSVTERRERGGICEFSIQFVEAGQDISGISAPNTQATVGNAADSAAPTSASSGFAGSTDMAPSGGGPL